MDAVCFRSRMAAASSTYGCSLDTPILTAPTAVRQAKALSKADVVIDEEETSMCASTALLTCSLPD